MRGDAVDGVSEFPFVILRKVIGERITLLCFDVVDIASAAKYIDEHIVDIVCGSESDESPDYAKSCCRDMLSTKLKNEALLHGAVAEFFSHLLLNFEGYKQNFLYQNLEERSVKKGFDGLYSLENEIWLMESKSGLYNGSLTHYDKVLEASNDLKNKVAGEGVSNNPWRNAYNHASHRDVGAKETIRAQIKNLVRSYVSGEFRKLSDFNIIPCATLFYPGAIESEGLDVLADKIAKYFSSRTYKEITVVCVSNAALDGILEYFDLRRDCE